MDDNGTAHGGRSATCRRTSKTMRNPPRRLWNLCRRGGNRRGSLVAVEDRKLQRARVRQNARADETRNERRDKRRYTIRKNMRITREELEATGHQI